MQQKQKDQSKEPSLEHPNYSPLPPTPLPLKECLVINHSPRAQKKSGIRILSKKTVARVDNEIIILITDSSISFQTNRERKKERNQQILMGVCLCLQSSCEGSGITPSEVCGREIRWRRSYSSSMNSQAKCTGK